MWAVQEQDTSLGSLLLKITLSDAKTRIKQTMSSLISKSTIQIIVEDLLKTLKVCKKLSKNILEHYKVQY